MVENGNSVFFFKAWQLVVCRTVHGVGKEVFNAVRVINQVQFSSFCFHKVGIPYLGFSSI